MKFVEKREGHAIVEMEKGETFDWIYFATTGLDIGQKFSTSIQVEHHIPVNENKVRIKIEVLKR